MTPDDIDKKIEDENLRHQNKILRLKKDEIKEKEHHQRTIDYLQNQKQRISKNKLENFEYKSRARILAEANYKLLNEMLEKFV